MGAEDRYFSHRGHPLLVRFEDGLPMEAWAFEVGRLVRDDRLLMAVMKGEWTREIDREAFARLVEAARRDAEPAVHDNDSRERAEPTTDATGGEPPT